jgi:hypothetical protein
MNIKNTFKNNPPGTIKLNDSLYFDVAPVDNLMYSEYLVTKDKIPTQSLKKFLENNPNYNIELPKKLGIPHPSQPIVLIQVDSGTIYNRHPKFSKYPRLVNSKEEAKLFCEWRTEMVMLNWAVKSKTKEERKEYPKKIRYRLPSYNEFMEGLNYFGYSKQKIKKLDDSPVFPFRLKYIKRPKKAIFLKRNISEITIDSIPFGIHIKDETGFNDTTEYNGFRCVCEIVEK